MRLFVNKRTALRLLRTLRARNGKIALSGRRIDLATSTPSPGKRWSVKRLEALVGSPDSSGSPIDVAVPSEADRLQMRSVRNTIHGDGLPSRSFVELGNGLAASCPELLFVELARTMGLPELFMLGFELCGSFSRDPDEPIDGPVTMGAPPVTSCARIERFLARARGIQGMGKAREALALIADNAWSPTESVVATMACLPVEEFGYGLAPIVLNERIDTPAELAFAAEKESRVPDILFEGTSVGINYDGAVHLDLESVVDASIALERNPGEAVFARALDDTLHKVRAKVVDDIRRNRELAADGLVVFPVVKEDLYGHEGLDRLMVQVMATIESRGERDLGPHRRVLASRLASQRRYELVRSLMPGNGRGSAAGASRLEAGL